MSVTIFKFLFHLHLSKLTLSTSLQCQIQAIWKRSSQTSRSPLIPFSKGLANFDHTLSLPVNMYFDSNTNSFQQKKTQLNFTLHTSKGDKSAGIVIIDLSQMLNNKMEVYQDKLGLEKCPDKNAKVEVRITCESKGESNLSEASGVGVGGGMLDVTNLSAVSLPGLGDEVESRKQQKKEVGNISIESENEKLRNEINLLKTKQDKTESQHRKQIQKLNSQISSIKQQLARSKTNQQSARKQYQQLLNQQRSKDEQYEHAKHRLEVIYDQLQQYI